MPKGADDDMDVRLEKVAQDINDLKHHQRENESKLNVVASDVQQLKISDKLQDREINSLKEVLGEIKGDTRYIRERMDNDRDSDLNRHKNFWWKVVAALIIAALLFYFGLESSI